MSNQGFLNQLLSQSLNSVRTTNLAAIQEACKTLGIQKICIQFDGCNDDEYIEEVSFTPSPTIDLSQIKIAQRDIKFINEQPNHVSIEGSTKLLEDAIEDYFHTFHIDHGISSKDEGSAGNLVIDIKSGEVTVDFNGGGMPMVSTQISTLSGSALDYAVGLILMPFPDQTVQDRLSYVCEGDDVLVFNPSQDWSIAGPFIHESKIQLICNDNCWFALKPQNCRSDTPDSISGADPLEAAMRMYAISSLGPTAVIPQSLTEDTVVTQKSTEALEHSSQPTSPSRPRFAA